MSESFEAWVQEMQLEYAAQIDQLKAELEQVKKERTDELERVRVELREVLDVLADAMARERAEFVRGRAEGELGAREALSRATAERDVLRETLRERDTEDVEMVADANKALETIATLTRERDEARALIAEIEAEDYWILEGQCTMQSCRADGKAIVAEARRRLARNAEMDSLEYTRK